MTEIITDPYLLRPCGSGQCPRKVGGSSKHCCGLCAIAWEASPRYEPHSHSRSCDERHIARGGVIHA